MNLGDFRKAPQGPYSFEYWESSEKIPSPIGPFTVELRPKAGQSPDKKIIDEAQQLAAFLVRHGSEVAKKVFEHYQGLADRPDWLEECGVPESLGINELGQYIKGRNLVVSHESSGSFEKVIFVDPLWDTEHKITFTVQDGRLEPCE